jgi:hypothetical protein
MSNKIKRNLEAKPKKVVLTDYEFNYLRSLDKIGNSFAHYINGLKGEYLKIITVEKHGFKADEDYNFEIDLQNIARELTVTKLTAPPSPAGSIEAEKSPL